MARALIFVAFVALLQLNFNICYGEIDDCCTVKLKSGTIRGNCSNANYDAYTNIPYARPPVGALRLEAPLPAAKWIGIRAANEPMVRCVQYNKMDEVFSGSEDCLYVNVYVPKDVQPEQLKVLLWIYPGAYQFGDTFISPEVVMSVGGAIVVTVSYRLGPTGFLSTKDRRIPGNLGLKDQRLALQWVKQNIKSFGGDSKEIILIGNSAGSAAVEYQMITGAAHNVKAFVSLSGSVLNPWAFTRRPEISARQLGDLLNCPFDAPGDLYKTCLKAKPIEDIWRATMDMHKYYAFSGALFRPTIEARGVPHAFLTKDPVELIRAGKYRKKPYLVGVVEGEGAYLASNLLQLNANNTEVIEELNERWHAVCPLMFYLDEKQSVSQQWQTCEELRQRYMCQRPFNLDTYKLLERMFGDEYFYNGIAKTVQLHRAAGQKVYRYIANLPTRYNLANVLMSEGRNDLCFGSVHTADAFGILPPPSGLMAITNDTPEIFVNTMRDLIRLILSITNEGSPPVYNNLTLPANIDDAASDQCLRFTYGDQSIATCQFGQIDCDAPLISVKCN